MFFSNKALVALAALTAPAAINAQCLVREGNGQVDFLGTSGAFKYYPPSDNTEDVEWALIKTHSLLEEPPVNGVQLGVDSFAQTEFVVYCDNVEGDQIQDPGFDPDNNFGAQPDVGTDVDVDTGLGADVGFGGRKLQGIDIARDWCFESNVDGASVTMATNFDAFGERNLAIAYCIAAEATAVVTCSNYDGLDEDETCENRIVYRMDPGSMKFSILLDSWPKGRSDLVLTMSVDTRFEYENGFDNDSDNDNDFDFDNDNDFDNDVDGDFDNDVDGDFDNDPDADVDTDTDVDVDVDVDTDTDADVDADTDGDAELGFFSPQVNGGGRRGLQDNYIPLFDKGLEVNTEDGDRQSIGIGLDINTEFGGYFSHGYVTIQVHPNGKTMDITFHFDKTLERDTDTDYVGIVYDPLIGPAERSEDVDTEDEDDDDDTEDIDNETEDSDGDSGSSTLTPRVAGVAAAVIATAFMMAL